VKFIEEDREAEHVDHVSRASQRYKSRKGAYNLTTEANKAVAPRIFGEFLNQGKRVGEEDLFCGTTMRE
jgi:hypothetical protein